MKLAIPRYVQFAGIAVLALVMLVAAPAASADATTQEDKASASSNEQVGTQGVVSFDCIVPRLGSDNCSNVGVVGAGENVEVCLDSSGGKTVDFTVRDDSNGNKLGVTVHISPGNCSIPYRNNSGLLHDAYLIASSPALVRVEAVGDIYVR